MSDKPKWQATRLDDIERRGAVLAGCVGVDSECVDPEVLAHRDVSAALSLCGGGQAEESA